MDNEKRPRNRIGIGLLIGRGIGVAIGVGTDNLPVWIAVGVAIGIAIGTVWDRQERGKDDNQDES